MKAVKTAHDPKIKYNLLFFLILSASLACAVCLGLKKCGFHEDEYYSYYSTCYHNGWNVPDGGFMTADDIQNEFTVSRGEGFRYGLVTMIQSWDVHPPLYYWLLHTVCSLTPGVFSKWQGLSLNLLFHAVSLILLYLCAKKLLKKEALALFVCACYAFSPAAMSCLLFIRMYTLTSCLVLLSAFLHIAAWEQSRLNRPRFLIPMACTLYLGFLTHYYFLIFHFFLSAGVCLALLIKRRRLAEILAYGFSACAAVALGILTYPASLGQMFRGQRGAEASHAFFALKNTWMRLAIFLRLADRFFLVGLLPAAGLLCLCWLVFLIRRRRACIGMPEILLFTLFGCFFTISKTALLLGDSSVRYIFPILGILLLTLFSGLNRLVQNRLFKWVRLLPCAAAALLLLLCLSSLSKGRVLFLYPEEAKKTDFARQNADAPVLYIYHPDTSWCVWDRTMELLCYRAVYFVSDANEAFSPSGIAGEENELLVYIADDCDRQAKLRAVYADTGFENCEKIADSKYCTLYRFY